MTLLSVDSKGEMLAGGRGVEGQGNFLGLDFGFDK